MADDYVFVNAAEPAFGAQTGVNLVRVHEMPYARDLVTAWLAHLGYTDEEVAGATADDPDPERCVLHLASGLTCLDEDGEHRHPIHEDLDQAVGLVMFALERLASIGALRPAGGETREEWRIVRHWKTGDVRSSISAAEVAELFEVGYSSTELTFERATVTTYPDGSTETSAWEATDAT